MTASLKIDGDVTSSRLRREDYDARTHPLATLEADTGAERMQCRFSGVIGPWRTAIMNGTLPAKATLRFQDFVGWHGRMVLSDLPESGDLRYRIVGEQVMDMFGMRLRPGDRFSALPHVAFEDYAKYFRAIRAGDVYGWYSGVIPFEGRDHRTFDVLDLPALDEEGRITFLYSFFCMCPAAC